MTAVSTVSPTRARAAMLLLAIGCAITGPAWAQSDWRSVAVPFYTSPQYAQASARAFLGRAVHWQAASQQLVQDLQSYCRPVAGAAVTAAGVQNRWRASVAAWDRLDALEQGPLVKRRSARAVDFMPARPAMVERAIETAPSDAAAMERIGAPAKGFEALETLLWPQPPQPDTPRCTFALAVAGHLARESLALAAAFAREADTRPETERADAVFSETLSQWVGGVETLRWAFMRKPLEVGASRGDPPVFPRGRSAQTADAWTARWSTLRTYAVLDERAPPGHESTDQLIAFETWLRSRGANALADTLVQTAAEVDRAMAAARPGDPISVQAAATALGRLTRLAQQDVAPALSVSLGFSDADGD